MFLLFLLHFLLNMFKAKAEAIFIFRIFRAIGRVITSIFLSFMAFITESTFFSALIKNKLTPVVVVNGCLKNQQEEDQISLPLFLPSD